MDQPTFNARMDELDAASPEIAERYAPKRMTSLDIKIAAAKRRAEAEKATHAIPQAVPTQGLTSEFSTAGCNIANQRKPAHGGRMPLDTIDRIADAVEAAGMQPLAAETVAEVIEEACGSISLVREVRDFVVPSLGITEGGVVLRKGDGWTEDAIKANRAEREQQLARKAFSAAIAAAHAADAADDAVTQIDNVIFRGSRADPFLKLTERLKTCPAAASALLARLLEMGVAPPSRLRPTRRLMRLAIPPVGTRTMVDGPQNLRFHIERSDEAVYLVVDGPGV